MTHHTLIQVALRRNYQRLNWVKFITDLSQATQIEPGVIRPIPPEESLELKSLIDRTVAEGQLSGVLRRIPELRDFEIAPRLAEHILSATVSDVAVLLCHYTEMPFRIPLVSLGFHVLPLVDFDGDTLYAVSSNARWGFGVDKYTSELSGEIRYTLDHWDEPT